MRTPILLGVALVLALTVHARAETVDWSEYTEERTPERATSPTAPARTATAKRTTRTKRVAAKSKVKARAKTKAKLKRRRR